MRYALEVMYDGTKFHGSQVQGSTPTVQLELNKALSTLLRTPTATYGASRTDEGVHALCNYYHFDVAEPLTGDLQYKCNAILPDGVAVKRLLQPTNPEFNCRFDAIARRYRYRVHAHKDPFLVGRALFYPFPLDRAILDATAAVIKEYEHFESFAKRNTQTQTFICKIKQSYWEQKGDELHYIVEANRFLRGMVRGLVATQLRIAKNKGTADELREIIEAKNCTKAFFNVAGHGLYLEEIVYPEGTFLMAQ